MHRRGTRADTRPGQGAVPVKTGTRWRQQYCCGVAFEAGGGSRCAAFVLLVPHAFEAGPLPGGSRGNGGRCYPHS